MKHYIDYSKEFYSDQLFISYNNHNITFSDFYHNVSSKSRALLRLNISDDNIVGIFLSNPIDILEVYFACIQINTPIYNRFQANYIDVLQLHCKADYSKKINNLLSFIMTLDYYRWSQEIYYKPNFICSVSLPFTLRNKIKVSSKLIYKGPRNSFASDTWPSPYKDSDGGKLDSQLYANLSIHYIYSKKISAYLDLNNITNSVNDVWPSYERLGFNGVFGLKYFF